MPDDLRYSALRQAGYVFFFHPSSFYTTRKYHDKNRISVVEFLVNLISLLCQKVVYFPYILRASDLLSQFLYFLSQMTAFFLKGLIKGLSGNDLPPY